MDDAMRKRVPLEAVRYDTATGLVPAIVQDLATGEVLMQAYTNREALKRTLATGQAWFWSRSRQEYWHKGAISGNTQQVLEVRLDCDGDAVLYCVKANGPACHTGERTCFHRAVSSIPEMAPRFTSEANMTSDARPLPSVVTTSTAELHGMSTILDDVWNAVSTRHAERPQGSYTTYLFTQGVDKIAKKLGEEAIETVIAAKNAVVSEVGRDELTKESADLLYHLLVLWKATGIQPSDIFQELSRRQSV